MMSFFRELQLATEHERAELFRIPQVQAGLSGNLTQESRLKFLAETYHYVRHLVPLFMRCGARLPDAPAWLREAIHEYIDQERGHEEWILNDIRNAGGDPETVRLGAPAAVTELLVAYAYYMVEQVNPIGMLGLMFVLESSNIELTVKAAHSLKKEFKLPQQALGYLDNTKETDPENMHFFSELMDQLERQEDKEAIVHCARMIYPLYGNILRSLPLGQMEAANQEALV